MTIFAKVSGNTVTDIIMADQEFIDSLEQNNSFIWVETSDTIRANPARMGFHYDTENDAFYSKTSSFPSWKFNITLFQWEAPIPMPTDGEHAWSESTMKWIDISLTSNIYSPMPANSTFGIEVSAPVILPTLNTIK